MDRIPLYPPATRGWMTLVAPFTTQWTVRRVAYVAARFLLSLAYFIALVVGLAVGGALAWTIPGLALLIAVIVGARWLGDLEALLARPLAGVPFRRPPTWFDRQVSLRQQARQVFGDPSTWTGLIYLLVDLSLGIASFVILVAGVAIAVTLALAPFALGAVSPIRRSGRRVRPGRVDGGHRRRGDLAGARRAGLRDHPRAPRERGGVSVRAVGGAHARQPRAQHPATRPHRPAARRRPAGGRDATRPASPAAPALASLTRREREVLRLIARGHSNAEIAEAFFVSEGPVKTHVKRVLAKLDVRDRTQAAVLAFNSGFVVPQTDAERTAEPAAPRERLALVR